MSLFYFLQIEQMSAAIYLLIALISAINMWCWLIYALYSVRTFPSWVFRFYIYIASYALLSIQLTCLLLLAHSNSRFPADIIFLQQIWELELGILINGNPPIWTTLTHKFGKFPILHGTNVNKDYSGTYLIFTSHWFEALFTYCFCRWPFHLLFLSFLCQHCAAPWRVLWATILLRS